MSAEILLVEDDDGDALLVRECLAEAAGAQRPVNWQRTLAAGMAALASDPVCVLLDLGLPDAAGLRALHAITDAAPDTPVIVLTGRHDATGTDAVGAGAQDYLVKDDIVPELLDRSIRYAIERKRAQRTRQQLREAKLSSAEYARLERGLLPTPLLRSDRVECVSYYQPGRDHAVLGGDFFDVVETADGRIRAVIGDVMGHGPDEAALGVHLRVAWRSLVLAELPEGQLLPSLATLLAAESGGRRCFVTACDLTVEPDLTVRLRVAGHPAPLVCADGVTSYLDCSVGPPLGVDAGDPADRWPESVAAPKLTPGGSLILYTDGLLESHRRISDERSLGLDEVITAVDACSAGGSPAASWIASLVGEAPNRSVDDTAIVVLSARPAPAP